MPAPECKQPLPITEGYTDCAGNERTFEIFLQHTIADSSYVLVAREKTESAGGYEFEVISHGYLLEGLGCLRDKIRSALSRRYLLDTKRGIDMNHDELLGRIGYQGLIVDGRLVDWETLRDLLLIREGFWIGICIHGGDE